MNQFPDPPHRLVAFVAAATARADQGAGPHAWGRGFLTWASASRSRTFRVREGRRGRRAGHGHAAMKADGEALKAVHTQMQTDLANGVDKAVLGEDAINVDAARQEMKADGKAMHDEVLSQLSPDQQDTLRACRLLRRPGRRRR